MSLRLFFRSFALVAVLSVSACEDDGPPPPPGRLDSGMRDGSVAPLPDGGECSTDRHCDDGVACNGEEACDDGTCVDRAPVECSDALDCTVDTCQEPDGSCQFLADDTLCGEGERCIVEEGRGCVLTCTEDATCDDGVACNGVEVCDLDASLCGPGIAVDCADGIVCTADACVEPAGTCTFTEDDTLCDSGESCVTSGSRGCIVECPMPTGFCEVLTPQCGCALGDGCYLGFGTTGRVCEPAGMLGVGSACTMVNECEIGVGCRALSTAVNICARHCDTDTDCPGTGRCAIVPLPTFRYCSQSCDPIAQTGCPAGAACLAHPGGFTDCRAPVGGGGQGFPCMTDAMCGAGFVCVMGQCSQYCTPSTACPGSTLCSTSAFSATIGSMTYGVCS